MENAYRFAVRGPLSGWQVGESEEDASELLLEGEETLEIVQFQTHKEVCGRCRGEGCHDHPAFSNGFTSSEWDEACRDDEDWAENYKSGMYDVRCEECGGLRVVDVIDEDKLSAPVQAALHDRYHEEACYRRECEAERRMGA